MYKTGEITGICAIGRVFNLGSALAVEMAQVVSKGICTITRMVRKRVPDHRSLMNPLIYLERVWHDVTWTGLALHELPPPLQLRKVGITVVVPMNHRLVHLVCVWEEQLVHLRPTDDKHVLRLASSRIGRISCTT